MPSRLLNLSRGRALVARQAHNLEVAGSIPAPATNILSSKSPVFDAENRAFYLIFCRNSVEGFSPVDRSSVKRFDLVADFTKEIVCCGKTVCHFFRDFRRFMV